MDFTNFREKIEEAKDKLGERGAEIIAEDLDIDQWDDRTLKGCCPFHREDSPSFVWNKKENYFKCFGCGTTFGIVDHYQKQGLSYIEAGKKLLIENEVEFNEYELQSTSKENLFKNYKFPKEELNEDKVNVLKYLELRGISEETANYCGIKEDNNKNIVFEHRDIDGRLLATKYRPASKKKIMFWQKGADTCPILYGVDKIDISKPLLIVEGHMDRLACVEAGYMNTVSIPHGANDMNWVEFNWDWLENFENIILWYDDDEVGQKNIKELSIRLGEHKIKIVEGSHIIKNKIRDFYKKLAKNSNIDKIDANNVLLACEKKEVLNLINKAKDVPIKNVSSLMDAEDFDIRKVKTASTGIKDLDKYIFGYIEGTLNLFTGFTASGKSTFILQSTILDAVESGFDTFIFSGELMKSQLKNWTVTQSAGRNHLIEWDNGSDKPKTYTVTNQAKVIIEDYYREKVQNYDDTLIVKPEDIISKMETLRKKRGIKNFIIDNMMMMELDIVKYGTELNAQKAFIIQLLEFTTKYGCMTHLVSHPKKPDGSGNPVTEYDILGSSNIPNLAHRIFSVRRVNKNKNPDDPYDAYICVLKDRILGVSKREIGVYYDVASRRLYGDNDDVNKKYAWDDGAIKYTRTKFGEKGILASESINKADRFLGGK